MKVFIFDPLWNSLVDERLTHKLADVDISPIVISDIKPLNETTELFEGNEERLLCLNPDYVGWSLKNEDYETIPNLKGILIASTGFEWVEKDAANRLGVPICNIRDFSTQAVAEWAITMMANLARQTPRLIKDDFPLDYDKDFMKYRGIQLKGKTAGIIGLGNIGSEIARACEGLGMNVIYWTRSPKDVNYHYASLEDLMSTADVIFPALVKNDKTRLLITDAITKTMKSSAILVDIAHGLFNADLVLQLVKEGKLFGYGFEAKPSTFTIYEGNVWAAPSYAWTTYESMYNSEDKLADNIVAAVSGEFPNKVN